MDELCWNCRFSEKKMANDDYPGQGPEVKTYECRRYPPATVYDINYRSPSNGWVKVYGRSWCGE